MNLQTKSWRNVLTETIGQWNYISSRLRTSARGRSKVQFGQKRTRGGLVFANCMRTSFMDNAVRVGHETSRTHCVMAPRICRRRETSTLDVCGSGDWGSWSHGQWRRQDFVSGGHRFGVVKRPKIINVCRTTPGSTVYS